MLALQRGSRIVFRVDCPMDFRLVQVRGPAVALGDHVFHTGTQRTIAFPRRGTYVFTATNLQSSVDMGLSTLGADNTLRLTVRVVCPGRNQVRVVNLVHEFRAAAACRGNS